MLREAHATWKEGPYTGEGAISTPGGILTNSKYSFGRSQVWRLALRPAKCSAAAISSSMSRMVAVEMAKVGIRPLQVETDSAMTLDHVGDALRIVGATLKITARTRDSEFGRLKRRWNRLVAIVQFPAF